ncbi:SMa0974 family conjugal transfer regulator [Rhizobium binxianense]
MYKHAAEAFVPVAHSRCVAERLSTKCRGYCLSIDATEVDKHLTFEDARAILRPAEKGIQMRVEGKNLVVFCGVRLLLQGQLATVATVNAEAVEWQPAGHVPFGTGGTIP